MIFYDTTNRKTFDGKVEEWVNNVRSSASQNISIVIVGNKIDDEAKRQVSTEEGVACADMLGVPFFEISAKTGACVSEAFAKLAELVMDNIDSSSESDDEETNSVDEKTQIAVDAKEESEPNCIC